jgi:hypothetical protein
MRPKLGHFRQKSENELKINSVRDIYIDLYIIFLVYKKNTNTHTFNK